MITTLTGPACSTEPHTAPLCIVCARFKGYRVAEPERPQDFTRKIPVCDAFLYEIPDEILDGADHRKPWPGDHGIQFELEDGKQLPPAFRGHISARTGFYWMGAMTRATR
jgi:hypothetical protein